MNPKVSVIIGLYNYARFVRKTVKSIRNQSFEDWEVIIVDDASTDKPMSVLKDILARDNRFKYMKQSVNRGISSTRNIGIRAAKGDLISYVDADDLLTENSLELRVNALNENPDVLWVHGRAYNLKGTILSPDKDFHKIWRKYKNKFPINLINYAKCVHSQSVMVRREFYQTLGLFDEEIDYGEEQDLWRRALAFGHKPIYIKECVCVYRHHSNQTRFHKDARNRKKKWLKISNKRLKDRLKNGINPKNTPML